MLSASLSLLGCQRKLKLSLSTVFLHASPVGRPDSAGCLLWASQKSLKSAFCAGKEGLVANITLPGTEIRALLKDRSELMTLRGANPHLVANMQQRADPFAVVSRGSWLLGGGFGGTHALHGHYFPCLDHGGCALMPGLDLSARLLLLSLKPLHGVADMPQPSYRCCSLRGGRPQVHTRQWPSHHCCCMRGSQQWVLCLRLPGAA